MKKSKKQTEEIKIGIQNREPENNKYIFWSVRIATLLLIFGIIFIPISYYFIFEKYENITKQGLFGDFIGGIVASIISVASAILFYSALKQQTEEFRYNRKYLERSLKTTLDNAEIARENFKLMQEQFVTNEFDHRMNSYKSFIGNEQFRKSKSSAVANKKQQNVKDFLEALMNQLNINTHLSKQDIVNNYIIAVSDFTNECNRIINEQKNIINFLLSDLANFNYSEKKKKQFKEQFLSLLSINEMKFMVLHLNRNDDICFFEDIKADETFSCHLKEKLPNEIYSCFFN